jgi:O-6-methylguanine DNA methyltransferase
MKRTAPAKSREMFAARVLRALARIPAGRVATYGDLAAAAGQPRAARAAGAVMRAAARPGLPYHRVIAAGGALGGYGGQAEMKAALLRAEGHVIRRNRLVDFPSCRWVFAAARRR